VSTPDYPLSLAVEDLVPTVLAFGGFWLLANIRPVRARQARLGAVLILAGGLAKCAWKLLVAAGGPDLPWLAGMLFPLMALGAALLLGALHKTPSWVYPAVVAAAGVAAAGLRTMQPIFILATLGVTAISVTGAVLAARRRSWLAAALFILSVFAVGALAPLRASEQHATLVYQWIEQGINTTAQAAFLLAVWLTVAAHRRWELAR
jgi:hypothetical protein